MENTQHTAISLFSGVGGDTLGLTQAGCNVIAYNELTKKSVSYTHLTLPTIYSV